MNTPNKLSLLRIILVPFMMFFYLATFMDPWGKFVAFAIFIIAALTDMLDGKIARKTGQITDLGKLLDPIADRLLYNVGFLLVVFDGTVPHPYGIICLVILLFRDFIIDGLRQIAASKGVVIQAFWSGKIKAILHDTQIPMFMLLAGIKTAMALGIFNGQFFVVFSDVLFVLALAVLAFATIVTIWSVVDYTIRSKDAVFGNGQKKEIKKEKQEKVESDEK